MKSAILPALFAALSLAARAAIVVPGADGSDGVLNITTNTEIDLSQAVTGTWDQNNAANAGKGVYDPAKWAVVFKYSSVNVAAGATVTFKNHASRAPVVWLVNGNVTIAGTVSLNGQDGVAPPGLAEPGPGGFRGGMSWYTSVLTSGSGFGIGGGNQSRSGGAFGTRGQNNLSTTYGNPSLIPLIGGSGGGGDIDWSNMSGGGGGGALLLGCSGQVSVSGTLRSNGGNGFNGGGNNPAAGSGGGIRVICDSIQGNGSISSLGGVGTTNGDGGLGRIRIERVVANGSPSIAPDPSVVPLAAGATALLWPPDEAPEVRIVSVGNVNAPADPRSGFGSAGADVALPQVSATQAIIETRNVEQAAEVKVRVTPRSNANATVVTATVQSVVSTDPLVIRWTATLPVNAGYSALQVHVVRP